jgi:hypothetical protein
MTEDAMVARLTAHAGVTALAGTRVYPLVIPQEAPLPAIRYARITTFRPQVMSEETGTAEIMLQLDSYATTYAGAKALGNAVRAALTRWRQAGTYGVDILDCWLESEQDVFEEDRREYRQLQTFMFHVRGD